MNDLLNDPEFLEWERNQVGDLVVLARRPSDEPVYGERPHRFKYHRGPSTPQPGSTTYAGEMFSLKPAVESRFKAAAVYLSDVPEEHLKDAVW